MTLKSPHSFFGPFSFYKRALMIALPVMAQLLIQNLVSLIDNFMVAGLGDIKMSGVNVAGQINFIFMVFVGALCLSGGMFMSQYNGAKNPAGMRQVFRFKIIVCLIAALVYTALCIFVPSQMMGIMLHGNTARDPILNQGVLYMQLIAFTWIPVAVSAVIGSSLREIGKVRQPLLISIVATLVNTFFNWMFIYGNLGAPRLEVQGAAIATIIARAVEMIAFIIYIYRTKPAFFTPLLRIFKVNFNLFGRILSKSFPILLTDLTWVFTETVTTALYNGRGGAEIVSGMAAGFTIANLFFICFNGIYTAVGVVVGSTLGANKLDEAKKQLKWVLSGGTILGVFGGICAMSTIFLIPIVYGSLSDVARITTRGLVLVCAAYMPVWALCNTQFAVSRAGGDTKMGLVVDITVNLLLFMPIMVILTVFTPIGPVGLYACAKLSDFAKIIFSSFWLKKGYWVRNLTSGT